MCTPLVTPLVTLVSGVLNELRVVLLRDTFETFSPAPIGIKVEVVAIPLTLLLLLLLLLMLLLLSTRGNISTLECIGVFHIKSTLQ